MVHAKFKTNLKVGTCNQDNPKIVDMLNLWYKLDKDPNFCNLIYVIKKKCPHVMRM